MGIPGRHWATSGLGVTTVMNERNRKGDSLPSSHMALRNRGKCVLVSLQLRAEAKRLNFTLD